MRFIQALNSYQRTRSGLSVIGLTALAVAAFCLSIVLATNRSYNTGLFLLALAVLGLGWSLQNALRLVMAYAHKRSAITPLGGRYRWVASVMATAFILFVPSSQLLLNVPTTRSIRLRSMSGPTICEGIDLQPGTVTNCLCMGVDSYGPGTEAIGFPFAVQEDECGSGYGPTSEPNVLAVVLDLVVAAIVDVALAIEVVLIARKAWSYVKAG